MDRRGFVKTAVSVIGGFFTALVTPSIAKALPAPKKKSFLIREFDSILEGLPLHTIELWLPEFEVFPNFSLANPNKPDSYLVLNMGTREEVEDYITYKYPDPKPSFWGELDSALVERWQTFQDFVDRPVQFYGIRLIVHGSDQTWYGNMVDRVRYTSKDLWLRAPMDRVQV